MRAHTHSPAYRACRLVQEPTPARSAHTQVPLRRRVLRLMLSALRSGDLAVVSDLARSQKAAAKPAAAVTSPCASPTVEAPLLRAACAGAAPVAQRQALPACEPVWATRAETEAYSHISTGTVPVLAEHHALATHDGDGRVEGASPALMCAASWSVLARAMLDRENFGAQSGLETPAVFRTEVRGQRTPLALRLCVLRSPLRHRRWIGVGMSQAECLHGSGTFAQDFQSLAATKVLLPPLTQRGGA
jgi:hypothetical protein